MTQWRRVGGILAVAAFPVMASSVFAADFTVQPRVSTGYQSYEFDIDVDDAFVDVDYFFGGLGVTGQVGKFFIDLYGQTNLTDAEDDVGTSNAAVDREVSVDRNELNLTAGYQVISKLTIFGGLKYAKNEIENNFSNGNSVDIDNEYFGPFAGAAFTQLVGNIGAISLSGSSAYLDGETTIGAEIGGINLADAEFDGTSIGYNLGVTWTGTLGPLQPSLSGLGYAVGLDYSKYVFEDDGDDQFDEKTLRARFDLKYRF